MSLDRALSGGEAGKMTLHVCDTPLGFGDATRDASGHHYDWSGTGLDWSRQALRSLYVSRDAVLPTLSAAVLTLALTFSEALDEDAEPAARAFTVRAGSNPSAVSVVGRTVTLALATSTISTTRQHETRVGHGLR